MGLPDHVEDALADNEACLLEPRDEYDDCVIGIGYRVSAGPLAVYSIPLVLKAMQELSVDDLEAQEFFEYNTIGAWMGDGTPIFIHLFGEDE